MSQLRPMYLGDLHKVIEIIESHDEDDAESAAADFEDGDFSNQYVLEKDDTVIGITGFRTVEATDNTCWLSWTYLDKKSQGCGLGRGMLIELLDKLRDIDCRKIFVKVSDYKEEGEVGIYEKALNVYQSLGFEEEVVNEHFYDNDENQMILGLSLRETDGEPLGEDTQVEEEKPNIQFNGIHEIAETDGAYSFSWEVMPAKRFLAKRSFTVEDLMIGINESRNRGGRKVFLTFPSNLPLIHNPLQSAGFKYCGQLTDYYEDGVHEFHFMYDLSDG